MVSWFLDIIIYRVAFPFDEILYLFSPSIMSVALNSLNLVLFFIVDKVR